MITQYKNLNKKQKLEIDNYIIERWKSRPKGKIVIKWDDGSGRYKILRQSPSNYWQLINVVLDKKNIRVSYRTIQKILTKANLIKKQSEERYEDKLFPWI